jgi:hypothetical protein
VRRSGGGPVLPPQLGSGQSRVGEGSTKGRGRRSSTRTAEGLGSMIFILLVIDFVIPSWVLPLVLCIQHVSHPSHSCRHL